MPLASLLGPLGGRTVFASISGRVLLNAGQIDGVGVPLLALGWLRVFTATLAVATCVICLTKLRLVLLLGEPIGPAARQVDLVHVQSYGWCWCIL